MKLEHFGQIKDGQLQILNQKRFKADLGQFKDCDVIIIVKKRGKRSVPQNAYYWSTVVHEINLRLRELGNDVDSEKTHEYLKQRFNTQYLRNQEGTVIGEVGETTTELGKSEFSEYIEKIKVWASETLEINIPDAGVQTAFFSPRSTK